MKKVIIFVFIFAAALVAAWISISAISNGNVSFNTRLIFKTITPSDYMMTQEMIIGDFDEIETSRVNIEYTVGTPGKAILTAPDNVINDVVVKTVDGELKVYIDNKSDYKGNTKATLTVSSSRLKDIDATLSSNVNINSPIVINDEFDVYAATSANVRIDSVSCGDAKLVSKTSASIQIASLNCYREASMKTSTSADLGVVVLTSAEIEAESSTSSSITVTSGKTGLIDLDATTSSDIKMFADYTGGKADASTSGNIILATDKLTNRATSTHGRIKIR